ncbi:hypothetical protein ILUMI_14584 [Ignelater luminosus]|uniref:Uncharacterized protein n=1 Tax=Ignelater luminosus TaxID=2038154 RepID=A0A8K0CS67_IGNLU|nr:hypothetical protein ILUMI_14584 [Ignelater luminosus]
MTWMNITENHVNGTEEQKRELEKRTQEQSSYWLEEREKHLIASKFELVCRRKIDDSTSMNLNIAAVAGCMSTGNGYSKIEELLPELMNILPMSSSTELQVQIGKPSL